MTELYNHYKECEGCKGCSPPDVTIRSSITCILRPHYIDKQGNKIKCPCKVCLIKGICSKSCVEFQAYYHCSYYSRKLSIRKTKSKGK